MSPAPRGRVLFVTGVSGGGKGTVIEGLRRRHPDLAWSVSLTTRAPRPGEVDGEHYHFVDDATFDDVIETAGFVEWEKVYGHRSGTPRAPIDAWLGQGRDVLAEGDPRGARALKAAYPGAVVVFLRPPDMAAQRERLVARGTTGVDLERRLDAAARELDMAADFDAVVVNDTVDGTICQVERLFSLSDASTEED